MEVEVTEMDVVTATSPGETPPPDIDYIILKVNAPSVGGLSLSLEFDPEVAIALGKDIAKQGKSAKND